METVKVENVKVTIAKPEIKADKTPVFIQRKISSETIAKEIASRITGKLIGFDDLYDAKTGKFLSENELKAVGAVFITVNYNKVLGDSDTVKKSRLTGNPTPYIRKTSRFQIIGNINWESFVNKRGHGNFIPDEKRSNGVENFAECKAVGVTKAGKFTLNGVAFKVLEETKYFDENGNEFENIPLLIQEYLKVQSDASKAKEAEKHGIDVKFDPKYRTVRIDSCDSIRCFGFDYQPTDN